MSQMSSFVKGFSMKLFDKTGYFQSWHGLYYPCLSLFIPMDTNTRIKRQHSNSPVLQQHPGPIKPDRS